MTDTKTLRIQRTFQAPAETVFDAWTSEEVVARLADVKGNLELIEHKIGVYRRVLADGDGRC